MNNKLPVQSENEDKKLMYYGNDKYTFINSTIWDCIKFWIKTKLLRIKS